MHSFTQKIVLQGEVLKYSTANLSFIRDNKLGCGNSFLVVFFYFMSKPKKNTPSGNIVTQLYFLKFHVFLLLKRGDRHNLLPRPPHHPLSQLVPLSANQLKSQRCCSVVFDRYNDVANKGNTAIDNSRLSPA